MKQSKVPVLETLARGAGLVCLTAGAWAQGLVATSGTVIATDGDPVPDSNGVAIPNFSFTGSGALGNNCVLAPDGNVFFQGGFVDSLGSTTTWNNKALFHGSSRSTLRMVARGGDQAPDLPAGVLLRSTSGLSVSISSTVRLTADGRLWWGALFTGTDVTSSNDEAWFGGDLGDQRVLVRQGDAAPGTVGALLANALSSPNLSSQGMNREGRIYFTGTLSGGDTTSVNGQNNQAGVWSGMPGALELVVRKSGPVSGLPGSVAIDTSLTLTSLCLMNDVGQLFYDVTLSPTQGTPPAIASNNLAYLVHTPGAGSAKLVREGDVAPGTAGATFNAISGDSWTPGVGTNAWNRNGQVIFHSDLRGGDVVGTTNDRAFYMGDVNGLTRVVREGDSASGTDGTFASFGTGSGMLNAYGRVAFQATLTGGTTTTANDTGIWTGTPGALTLVVREGQTMPGVGGTAGSISQQLGLNDLGQVLLSISIVGGTSPGASVWGWDPIGGLTPVALIGDQVEVAPGVFRAVVSGSGLTLNGNTDGAALCFGHDGTIAFRVALAGSTNAIVRTKLPHPCVAPTVTGQAASIANLCAGSGARFSVAVGHSTDATYQWLHNGAPLANGGSVSGADALVLSIDPVAAGDAGSYECVATTSCGNATSAIATLTVDSTDTDLDGTADCADGCPSDPLKIAPGACGCGNLDTDSDGDLTADCNDGCPNDPLKTAPGVCGCGVADADADADGTPDCTDGCPLDPLKTAPGACGCGVVEIDSDEDGTADCVDGCPFDPFKTSPGACGCDVPDTDTDLDGTADCNDGCPNDPLKIAPGVCGCGVADTDTDADGTPDCNDGCPLDAFKTAPGVCGCGVADADTDADGTADCNDGCPNDPLKVAPGACGCGVADTDSDLDGTADCNDGCPADPLKTAPGACGCGVVETDADADGAADCVDNCVGLANPAQADQDSDGLGDACDNCPLVANASQSDCDGDLQGDACEIANGLPDCNANGIPDACDIASLASADLNANAIPDECETNGGTPFCFGYTGCPCGNNAAAGSGQGCANSSGAGAMLVGSGASSLTADGLVLSVTGLQIPAGSGSVSALFFQGDAQTNVPFNDGRRCVSGSQIRLGTKTTSTGAASYPGIGDAPIGTQGSLGGPGARFYQVWYRNPIGPCGSGTNFSNGVAVIWAP